MAFSLRKTAEKLAWFVSRENVYRFLIPATASSLKSCYIHVGPRTLHQRVETSNDTSSSSEEDVTQEEDTYAHEEDLVKEEILQASLLFVSKHGWSKEAIAAGAESIGYPGVAHGIFPNAAADLISHFYVSCNDELEEHLRQNSSNNDTQKSQRSSETVLRDGIETRLRMIIPYHDKWPQAMAIMAYPSNIPLALKHHSDLINTLWFYAGDKSSDVDWYAKRLALSAVYSATELCFVQDSSPDFQKTWEFLDRRMKDMFALRKTVDQVQKSRQIASDLLIGSLITARNMLGLRR